MVLCKDDYVLCLKEFKSQRVQLELQLAVSDSVLSMLEAKIDCFLED